MIKLVSQQPITLACTNLAKKHWFHSLPFQQLQVFVHRSNYLNLRWSGSQVITYLPYSTLL